MGKAINGGASLLVFLTLYFILKNFGRIDHPLAQQSIPIQAAGFPLPAWMDKVADQALIGAFTASMFAFWLANALVKHLLETSVERTVVRTKEMMNARLNGLNQTVSEAMSSIHKRKESFGAIERWASYSGLVAVLVDWIEERARHVDISLDSSIWRIRSSLFWQQYTGLASTVVLGVLVLASATTVGTVVSGLDPTIFVAVSFVFLSLSFLFWDPPVDLVEQHIGRTSSALNAKASPRRSQRIRAHVRFAFEIYNDKGAIWRLENPLRARQ